MAWLFVPGLEASSSACASPSEAIIEPWVTLSGTAMQRQLSWPGWKTRPWISRLLPTISSPLTAARGVESWISSLRASRVSRGRWPARDSAPRTSAGSGPQSSASFARWDRATCFWKTFQGSLPGMGSDTYSETWPRSGSMRSGCATARRRKALRTNASGCGFSLPTPRASEGGTNQSPSPGAAVRPTLTQMARHALWPTPTTGDAKQSGSAGYSTDSGRHTGTTLTDALVRWPTPRGSDGAKGGPNQRGSKGDLTLVSAVHRGRWATPTAHDAKGRGFNDTNLVNQVGGRLSPTWVEWLMGWPLGWTDCASPATESYQQWLRVHSASFGDGSTGDGEAV